MPKESTGSTAVGEQRRSARESDVSKGKQAGSGKVSGIEKAGGKSGVRFSIPGHPDKSVVRGPRGSMD